MNTPAIINVKESNQYIVDGVNRLLCQLVSNFHPITENELSEIINSDSNSLYLIFLNNEIVGMFTLGNYISPTGRKFWLEDVVVDNQYRGLSLGRMLVDEAKKIVSASGKSTLMLTSKPVRIAANRLYISSGFLRKETNVYKMDFNE
ncbi:GNAT family N-acetyltransferase [Bacteroides caecigallinarum]|uniref:GNAT family N-acetyltransferase n=1 Tax=Bacteroides caecigallinarum TaxID=1411144 RepID=UPI00195C3D99|nr:GNAT family N-acetyltransferase [Bacteroides caecigallinarum]MBM6881468.1 GNAT family N-acetyltransferase [Bacteroides caecigallinarum]